MLNVVDKNRKRRQKSNKKKRKRQKSSNKKKNKTRRRQNMKMKSKKKRREKKMNIKGYILLPPSAQPMYMIESKAKSCISLSVSCASV